MEAALDSYTYRGVFTVTMKCKSKAAAEFLREKALEWGPALTAQATKRMCSIQVFAFRPDEAAAMVSNFVKEVPYAPKKHGQKKQVSETGEAVG